MAKGFEKFLRRMAAMRLEHVGDRLQSSEEYRAAVAKRGSADKMEADEATGEVMSLVSEESYLQGLTDGMALVSLVCGGSETKGQVAHA